MLLALGGARSCWPRVDGRAARSPLADYFTGYRASVRRAGELIRAIRIPLPLARLTAFHKIAKRRFDDISSVAVGFAIDVDATASYARARIGLGGVAATPIRAVATEAALVGRPWTARDRRRGRRGPRRRGHPDRRPPRQRPLPRGDARTEPAEAATLSIPQQTDDAGDLA